MGMEVIGVEMGVQMDWGGTEVRRRIGSKLFFSSGDLCTLGWDGQMMWKYVLERKKELVEESLILKESGRVASYRRGMVRRLLEEMQLWEIC